MSNHETLAKPPTSLETESLPLTTSIPSTSGTGNTPPNGRRSDDDQSATRFGGPEMRLARLPTEPARDEHTDRRARHGRRRSAGATAVADDRERFTETLYDTVMHRLFAAGLELEATARVVDSPTKVRLDATIDLLDSTISELRKAMIAPR